ncbi:MAG: DHA1 family bicyclomycin/chloramphenicol resistance-like MFS transporter [Glaciecola sp.]|jgi:DHA1 family bicyclomycin/chloramphenicol resistance-like MFS transporter
MKKSQIANNPKKSSFIEFVALMAIMTSLVAFTIDSILPGLSLIGDDLKVINPNTNHLLLSMVFLGLSIGQLLAGPFSDIYGRKAVVYFGLGLYVIGTTLSFFSQSFTVMIIGRLLQGLGLGGPRIASIAMIRDQYSGNAMARVMSFVMVVFIFIPAVAPYAGQGIMSMGSWRTIFLSYLIYAFLLLIWFHFRQEETLPVERRTAFSMNEIMKAVKYIFKNKITMGYTLASGFISGAFLGYLNLSEQIFAKHYNLGELFPRYFALLAIGLGLASFLNGRMVMKLGMTFLAKWSVAALFIWSAAFTAYDYFTPEGPSLELFLVFLLVALFFIGILFGNMKSLSMEPLGHIAGVGAAVVSAMSTLAAVPYSILIGQYYNDSVFPLMVGFTVCSLVAGLIMVWTRTK